MSALSTSFIHAPAANTEALVAIPATDGGTRLQQVEWSYSAAPTGGILTVEDGSGVVVKKFFITAGGPGFITFEEGVVGDNNTALLVRLTAGGDGISGTVSATVG